MKVMDLTNLPELKKALNSQHREPVGQRSGEQNAFSDILKEAFSKANDLQIEADDLMEKMATGEVESIHQVMVGVTKAEIALQFVLELRNKLTEMYKEIMRMPV